MYDDEKDQNAEIVVDARPHVVNNRRKGGNPVRKSPRYVAQFAARAKRFGFKVSQFNDLSILVANGDLAVLFYPDEDSEPVVDLKGGDQVTVVGRDGVFEVHVVGKNQLIKLWVTDYTPESIWVDAGLVNHIVE